jgi:hypothetical protein
MPIQEPNDALHPVERRRGIAEFALAAVVRALAAADAAEIKTQGGKVAFDERIVHGIDDLVVHRAAVLRMGMQDKGDRGRRRFSGAIAAFEASGGAGKKDFRHLLTYSCYKTPKNLV